MKLALGQEVYEILYNFLHKCYVWSSALVHRLAFWTSASSPPPQRPICRSFSPHHAKKADCKAIRQSHSANSNPPVQFHYFHASHQPIPPSKAPAISATSESGTRTYLPSGTNHFPIGLSAPALTASTANFFPATQKNIIAASIAPSGQM